MNNETRIKHWLLADKERMSALEAAAGLRLSDWCLAAGFVRNLVWDRLHGDEYRTPLNDIDLIYFDGDNCSDTLDKALEKQLGSERALPWSVKNQARMHARNDDSPYLSTLDAMSYWVEIETAIGARLTPEGEIELIAPFGCDPLFGLTVTINGKRRKPDDFEKRLNDNKWLTLWPKLRVVGV